MEGQGTAWEGCLKCIPGKGARGTAQRNSTYIYFLCTFNVICVMF